MKEMKQILPNTRVFVIHTANSVINTLNWGVMTYALIALSYRRPGNAFDWVNITDPISAQYVTAFLICFCFAFILCFCNVVMFMQLINNYLNAESEKEDQPGDGRRASLNAKVYFNHCIAL